MKHSIAGSGVESNLSIWITGLQKPLQQQRHRTSVEFRLQSGQKALASNEPFPLALNFRFCYTV
jgi:hypothetical protein